MRARTISFSPIKGPGVAPPWLSASRQERPVTQPRVIPRVGLVACQCRTINRPSPSHHLPSTAQEVHHRPPSPSATSAVDNPGASSQRLSVPHQQIISSPPPILYQDCSNFRIASPCHLRFFSWSAFSHRHLNLPCHISPLQPYFPWNFPETQFSHSTILVVMM